MSKRGETRGERQQRLATEALAAQESGEWDPAPAGAAAAADSEAAVKRREWAEAVGRLNSAKEWAQNYREWLNDAKAGNKPEETLRRYRCDVEEAEAKVAEAEAELEKLRTQREAES